MILNLLKRTKPSYIYNQIRTKGLVGIISLIIKRIYSKAKVFFVKSVKRASKNNFTFVDVSTGAFSEFFNNNHRDHVLISISMIRNESEIFDSWIGNKLNLFDRIILIDHMSTDGTYELMLKYAKEFNQIEVYRFQDPGYYQSDLMTYVYDNLINKEEKSWVFFLDADEFLNFNTSMDFRLNLAKSDSYGCILLPWVNFAPKSFDNQMSNNGFFTNSRLSSYNKIALQPHLLKDLKFKIAQGNHSITSDLSTILNINVDFGFPLYHFPIRSLNQLKIKIDQGVDSYRKMGSDWNRSDGFHWVQLRDFLKSPESGLDLLKVMAIRYAEDVNYIDIAGDSNFSESLISVNLNFFNKEKFDHPKFKSRRYRCCDAKKIKHVSSISFDGESFFYNG